MSNAITTEADTVRELEWRRYRAMRDGDAGALDTLLADELVYTHSNGDGDSKSSLLAKVRDHELRCPDVCFEPDERVVVDGGTAIVTGRVTGTVHANGTAIDLCNRALAVWSHRREGWRLLAYQSTPIPNLGQGK